MFDAEDEQEDSPSTGEENRRGSISSGSDDDDDWNQDPNAVQAFEPLHDPNQVGTAYNNDIQVNDGSNLYENYNSPTIIKTDFGSGPIKKVKLTPLKKPSGRF